MQIGTDGIRRSYQKRYSMTLLPSNPMNSHALLVFLIAGTLVTGAVAVASAHDTETVDGYDVTFGGADEPVITDERMWLEVNVVDSETEEPVEGLEESLTMAVQRPFGNDTHELDVSSRFGEPGWYEAPIVFTEPGTYTVFVNGSIDGTAFTLTFQKQVHNASTLEYPPRSASNSEGRAGSLTEGFPGIVVGAGIAVLGMAIAFVAGRRI